MIPDRDWNKMTEKSKKLAEAIAYAAWDKLADNVTVMFVGDLVGYTDYFVVCTGRTDRHVNAIADGITDAVRINHHDKPFGTEGRSSGRWICLDYVDVVVHVMSEPVREFYQLEKLWGDAPRLQLKAPDWMNDPARVASQAQTYL